MVASSEAEKFIIRAVPLGAGQDVGRSCIIVSIGKHNIMLDCGMHMGFKDARKFPDFSYINPRKGGDALGPYLDCVIISHFHLDHCGALPYMTEQYGYNGKIYMTFPTKAIVPLLLEDYRRIQCDYQGDRTIFTTQDIRNCMNKCIPVSLHEWIQVNEKVRIRACYAGHVLGAAMFQVQVGDDSVLYTGDFNCTPDRHLGPYRLFPNLTQPLKPDLLITETTYATTVRESKRGRESAFLKKIKDVLDSGGKVLIPVFALGRAQELFILIERFWERFNLQYPTYYTAGMAEKACVYYKQFITWTNETIEDTFSSRNVFDFKYLRPFENSYASAPGPMLIFSTPGMLHSGRSLQIFKILAPDPLNCIIMPGYCVPGTVGHKVINGAKRVEIDGYEVPVNLKVEYMSFSAHADAKGIIQLIQRTQPCNVMFVHGEHTKMKSLKNKLSIEMPNLPVYLPANGCTVNIQRLDAKSITVPIEKGLLEYTRKRPLVDTELGAKARYLHGHLVPSIDVKEGLMVISTATMEKRLGLQPNAITFTTSLPLPKSEVSLTSDRSAMDTAFWRRIDQINHRLKLLDEPLDDDLERPCTGFSNHVRVTLRDDNIQIKWRSEDNHLAEKIVATMKAIIKSSK